MHVYFKICIELNTSENVHSLTPCCIGKLYNVNSNTNNCQYFMGVNIVGLYLNL